MRIKRFIREEAVLTAAVVLAVLSAFFTPPDARYIGYIDFRTLGILFSLMTVMAGLRRQGVFHRLGQALLARAGGMLRLVFVLVGLCFFGSMFITNDVALMTFVPFTFVVLGGLGEETRRRFAPPVVCMQTVAANLGSMLTPIGNPQNLYLYGKSGISLARFLGLTLPYSAVSLALLALWAVLLCRGRRERLAPMATQPPAPGNRKIVEMYAALFVLCLLAVIRVVPYPAAFAVVLLCVLCADRATLRRVDYSLLMTFVALFIFTGNLGRVTSFSAWLQGVIAGREVPVAVLASQVTCNVPAALLLSGFTENTEALIIGTNLGGLGTLIASMASLISYRQIAREMPGCRGRYFGLFTISNLIFLVILLAEWAVIAG